MKLMEDDSKMEREELVERTLKLLKTKGEAKDDVTCVLLGRDLMLSVCPDTGDFSALCELTGRIIRAKFLDLFEVDVEEALYMHPNIEVTDRSLAELLENHLDLGVKYYYLNHEGFFRFESEKI